MADQELDLNDPAVKAAVLKLLSGQADVSTVTAEKPPREPVPLGYANQAKSWRDLAVQLEDHVHAVQAGPGSGGVKEAETLTASALHSVVRAMLAGGAVNPDADPFA
jgi:hypothetical protein